ncbi:MAG TPA: hypothetical protein DCL21_02095, partial [Alphaproteobacteria bacterium]|nr:hypothetical protein [Alphaproteobacteria bacterium]
SFFIKEGTILENAFSKLSESYDPDIKAEEKVKEYNVKQVFGVIVDIVKDDAKQNLEQRKNYAHKIFSLLCVWSSIVILALAFKGFYTGFNLSDNVLLVLMSTVFMELIGLFVLVAKYLFKESDQLHLLISNICKDSDILKSINN